MDKLRMVGLTIYRCEGSKRGSMRMVELINSDEKIIKTFVEFLRKVMKVPNERFRVRIHIHDDNNENESKEYWSKITNIPLNQFQKTAFKAESKGISKNRLKYGSCVIRVHSKELFDKIIAETDSIF